MRFDLGTAWICRLILKHQTTIKSQVTRIFITMSVNINSFDDVTALVASALPHLKQKDKLEFGLALLALYHKELLQEKGINK